MGKVTVDKVKPAYGKTPLLVSDEEDKRVYSMARKASDLFEEAGWGDGLEVIKCTVRRQYQHSAQESQTRPFLMVTFQLPITPPYLHGFEKEFLKNNRLEVWIEWEEHHADRLRVHLGGDIVLKDTEIETVAKGLVQAVRQAVTQRQHQAASMEVWLDREARSLESVFKEQVVA